jgi:type IV fimbrial biogenesis protein FimT
MCQPQAKRMIGFTLIELMVTIAVVAIMLALAAPSFADFIDKSRLKGAANGVVDLINSARAESVKQSRDISISLGGTTTAWCAGANAAAEPTTAGDAVPAVCGCTCTTASSCIVNGEEAVFGTAKNDGVELMAAPSGSFVFDSHLGAVDGLGETTFTMTSPRKKFDLQLTVTPLGQVNLCVPSSSDLPITGYPSC